MNALPPRLLPRRRLPDYAYIPGGRFPHPARTDHGGAAPREPWEPAAVGRPEAWQRCEAYLWGIDLFNHGYYWEAHESWEAVWLAAGRSGRIAVYCKGLIRLAAAGVKARQGRPAGVARHFHRAAALLRSVMDSDAEADQPPFMGLALPPLVAQADALRQTPEKIVDRRPEPVVIVMPFSLWLAREPSCPESASRGPSCPKSVWERGTDC